MSSSPWLLSATAAADEEAAALLEELASRPDLPRYITQLCNRQPEDFSAFNVWEERLQVPADYAARVLYDSSTQQVPNTVNRTMIGVPLWIRRPPPQAFGGSRR